MTVTEATQVGRDALMMILVLSAPVLLVVAFVGAIISLLQAVTQVHEVTLTFLPKLLAVALVLAVASGWMMEQAVGYGQRSFEKAGQVSR